MRLFISHASEDKEAIARPLAEELNKTDQVWYDEFSLHAGQSIRAEIDRGLRECDFGVVILSPNFFKKQWTSAELDGLFSLESINRKIIIPVWHGVGLEEVKQFSPMLAGRLAIDGRKPPKDIAEEIRIASQYSERVHDILDPSTGAYRITSALKRVSDNFETSTFLQSGAGVAAFRSAGNRVFQKIYDELSQRKTIAGKDFFRINVGDEYLNCEAPYLLFFRVDFPEYYLNTALRARLVAQFYRCKHNPFGSSLPDKELGRLEWSPRLIGKDAIGWQPTGDFKAMIMDENQVASEIMSKLAEFLDQGIDAERAKKIS